MGRMRLWMLRHDRTFAVRTLPPLELLTRMLKMKSRISTIFLKFPMLMGLLTVLGHSQRNRATMRKMEKQRNMDEQNWKAQMDAVHDVLDTKVNEKPFEDLKHCVASLTKGVVKFAQVVGVFPGPKFDDADGADQGEADVELLGWEECAENMSFRVDKAWRQRCSQRFRNILDMIAKKADHSVLRLL